MSKKQGRSIIMMEYEKLIKDCPNLYRHGMYFECGPGWYKIIENLSHKLEALIDGKQSFYATQVKEKYGTLRFYMSLETKDMGELIEEAGCKTSITCEDCGKPGILRNDGWVRVTCLECEQLSQSKRN